MQKGGTNPVLVRQASECRISSWIDFFLVLGRKMCSEVWPTLMYEVLSHFLNCVLIF